jgi:glycerol-3-phosphate dehydrogenase (NAD(P)+)
MAEIGQVVEGVSTVKHVKEKADELGVYMPLVNGLYKIIYEQQSIKTMIASLMLGEQALDVEFEANQEKVLSNEEI